MSKDLGLTILTVTHSRNLLSISITNKIKKLKWKNKKQNLPSVRMKLSTNLFKKLTKNPSSKMRKKTNYSSSETRSDKPLVTCS